MKEFIINGSPMKCYPLTAAQRLHYYTIKYCPFHQVLCIGTGLYFKQDINFDVLKDDIVTNKTKLTFSDELSEIPVEQETKELICIGNKSKERIKVQITTKKGCEKYEIRTEPQII
ncbi:MAG: hypothetical protein IJX24_02755, partial [Oscillospiraceae bacterium]|nr:hypothetical protein [Oscillospiraceae bacterium]